MVLMSVEWPHSSQYAPACANAQCACLDLTLLFAMVLSSLPS